MCRDITTPMITTKKIKIWIYLTAAVLVAGLFLAAQPTHAETADTMPIANLELVCNEVWTHPVTQPTTEAERTVFYLMVAVANLCDTTFSQPVPTAHTIGWYSRGLWLTRGKGADMRLVQMLRQIFYENADIRVSDAEHLAIFFYDDDLNLIGRKIMSTGNHNSVVVRADDIAKEAQRFGAKHIVFTHNHPNGACFPSQSDLSGIQVRGKYFSQFDIQVHDYVVVTKHCLYSLEAHKQSARYRTNDQVRASFGYKTGE